MDFDLIASEYARHRKIMLPVLDASIDRNGAVLELGSGTGTSLRSPNPPAVRPGASIAPRAC